MAALQCKLDEPIRITEATLEDLIGVEAKTHPEIEALKAVG